MTGQVVEPTLESNSIAGVGLARANRALGLCDAGKAGGNLWSYPPRSEAIPIVEPEVVPQGWPGNSLNRDPQSPLTEAA